MADNPSENVIHAEHRFIRTPPVADNCPALADGGWLKMLREGNAGDCQAKDVADWHDRPCDTEPE